jgi:glucose-1-phosphate cytidylyltransferase
MKAKSSISPLDVVIFCGGRGTRLSEKTHEMPKPLIELGEYPILWHIMKIYSHYSYRRFILTLGYKGEMISDYFLYQYPLTQNFHLHLSDPRPPLPTEDWELNFVKTGCESKTARRLLLCKDYLTTHPFMLTYGDGVADINLNDLIERHQTLHKKYGVIATITLTRPYSKYGIAKIEGELIETFNEKPLMDDLINVGFMVLEPEIFEYIRSEEDVMFEDTLQEVAADGKLGYYIHEGFWHAMDNYKDYEDLNKMWKENPKWKIWDN